MQGTQTRFGCLTAAFGMSERVAYRRLQKMVDDASILWNGATQAATILKGTVIQMKVGSKVMIVNGASITMDTAPKLVPAVA